MTTLGELTQELLKRKSRLSIMLMQLEHLEEMYLPNDAGEAEVMLSHTDGGRVADEHLSEFRDDLLEQIDGCTAELAQMEQVKLPVILPKLLGGEDPEDPDEPDEEDDDPEESEEDDAQETLEFGDEDGDDTPEPDEVEDDDEDAEDDAPDEVEGDEDSDGDEPAAQAS